VKPAGLLLLAILFLSGCRTAHDVAVSSFRVLDAPANYVRRHIDGESNTTTTATTIVSSDAVTTPGRTVTPSTTNTQRPTTQNPPRTTVRPSPGPTSSPPAVTEKTKPAPTQSQLPTAKPVPGKPGYVFSPFDPSGGYVDVTGYTPGQKVKDPYSGKIFLVP
jgi:hypothetical protein